MDVDGDIRASDNIYGNVIYIGNSTTRGIRPVSGGYGTVQTTGVGVGNHDGYSIDGRYVFMSYNNDSCGIFNDLDNDWMAYFEKNGSAKLYYAGNQKLNTTGTGINVSGLVSASTGSFSNNVGIGNTSPNEKLDVSGSITADGYLNAACVKVDRAYSYQPAIQIGGNSVNPGITYLDEEIYSLRWGGNSNMGMGLHSSTKGTFGKQGLLIHIPNTEEFSVKTGGWTDIFSLDGATKKAYFAGNVGIGTG